MREVVSVPLHALPSIREREDEHGPAGLRRLRRRVVFTVDLESGRVELAELYTESLEHFDTGLDRSPGSAEGWARWQGKAQQIVGRFLADGLNDAPLRWNTEQADD